jgi:hypothetical protein
MFFEGKSVLINNDSWQKVSLDFSGHSSDLFFSLFRDTLSGCSGSMMLTQQQKNECRGNSLQTDENCSHDYILDPSDYHNGCSYIFGFLII